MVQNHRWRHSTDEINSWLARSLQTFLRFRRQKGAINREIAEKKVFSDGGRNVLTTIFLPSPSPHKYAYSPKKKFGDGFHMVFVLDDMTEAPRKLISPVPEKEKNRESWRVSKLNFSSSRYVLETLKGIGSSMGRRCLARDFTADVAY